MAPPQGPCHPVPCTLYLVPTCTLYHVPCTLYLACTWHIVPWSLEQALCACPQPARCVSVAPCCWEALHASLKDLLLCCWRVSLLACGAVGSCKEPAQEFVSNVGPVIKYLEAMFYAEGLGIDW